MTNNIEISLLYDFYGHLLNETQRQVVELSVNDDLSLSEVADILEISRQGVRDTLNRSKTKLYQYEEKLGLYKRALEHTVHLETIVSLCNDIESGNSIEELHEKANDIKNIATMLLEMGG